METKYLYIGSNGLDIIKLMRKVGIARIKLSDRPFIDVKLLNRTNGFAAVIFEAPEDTKYANQIIRFLKENTDPEILMFVVAQSASQAKELDHEGVDDMYTAGFDPEMLVCRAEFMRRFKSSIIASRRRSEDTFRLPRWKRAFDIVFASAALIVLSPILLLITAAIVAESKGRPFYASRRVGAGYKVFNFYKFRSMYVGADAKVDQLMSQNQYSTPDETPIQVTATDTVLIGDSVVIPESVYIARKVQKQNRAFFKMANDPRITRVGRLLRNTSLDELPQLVNVLLGDMSVVGNRPLPLYEAEQLTADDWAARFLAPAGLTGIWQVQKRGGANVMSADERKQLDVEYARGYSFLSDLSIILRTLPAMMQHENV